ncbi:hypothetical protein ACH82I_14285 [Brevibacterium sp. GP-SGM9]|uniref:hypothetical protein n=1 Tax=Brevibacterium sp. GP-SGM9 TaxID=3376990 RepID=UPI0039A576F8
MVRIGVDEIEGAPIGLEVLGRKLTLARSRTRSFAVCTEDIILQECDETRQIGLHGTPDEKLT